jgi:Transglycosylase-like domain
MRTEADTNAATAQPRGRIALLALGGLAAALLAVVLPAFVLGGTTTPPLLPDESAAAVAIAPIAPPAPPAEAYERPWTPEEVAAVTNLALAGLPPDQQLQIGFYLMSPDERARWAAMVGSAAAEVTEQPITWVVRTFPVGTPLPPGSIVISDPSQIPGNTGSPVAAVPAGSVWDDLAWCESGGNWATSTGNGYYGGLQFLESTWISYGGQQFAAYPHLATREQQIAVAERVLAHVGWGAWPACSRKLGLR